jgi:NUMOD4 motif/HNH endonuclease
MNSPEIWMAIPDYEGYYEVSSMGRVRSLPRISHRGFKLKGKIIKGSPNQDGYLHLRLWKDGAKEIFRVHRLVALAFIRNPENKPRVNHIDNNRSNNALSNLEWATHQEDVDHKCRQNRQNRPVGEKNYFWGKKGPDHPRHGKDGNLSPIFGGKSPYAKLVLDTETGIFYDCVKDAAKAKIINASTLYGKLCGNRKNNTSLILLDPSTIRKWQKQNQ